MTLVTGSVQDLGMEPLTGTLWARPARFRSDGTVVYAPERTPFPVVNGVVSAELAPGPAVLELKVGSHARGTFEVVIPDQATITLADLLDTVFSWEPEQVSQFVAEREAAQAAALEALGFAGDAETAQDAAELAAQATSGDRSHIDQVRDELDAAFDASTAGNVLPPRLTETALNATYGTKAELADKLDAADATATYVTQSGLADGVAPLVPPLVASALAADDTPALAAEAAVQAYMVGHSRVNATVDGLMPNTDKVKLDALATATQLRDMIDSGVVKYTATNFAPVAGVGTYSEVTVPMSGMRNLYVRGSVEYRLAGMVTGHRQDGTTAVISAAGEAHYVPFVATVATVFSIPAEFTRVTVRLYNSTHSRYRAELPPLVLVGLSTSRIANFLRDEIGTEKKTAFPTPRHAVTITVTYNTSPLIFTYPGMQLEYQVKTSSAAGAVFEWGKPNQALSIDKGVLSFSTFGIVALSTYNSGHTGYVPGFDAYYRVALPVPPPSGVITGTYLSTPTLKAVREMAFTDGTSKAAIQYLWHDATGTFYISSSLRGDKKEIFKYRAADFHGAPVERWSMGFDKFGNILCVFRVEQLSWSSVNDALRQNPILIDKSQGYKPVVIDFGAALKPTAWLQDSGFLATDEYVMLTEYTRPNVSTANTWRASYPISDPANWESVQQFPVVEPFKHIHMVDRDPHTGHVYTSTGDVDAAAGIYASTDGGVTFQTVIQGSEKHCRVLNFVFTKDWIYWATDSVSVKHWLFRAPRLPNGIMDAGNIDEVVMFPYDSAATYATIHMPKIDALLFLGRADAPRPTIPVDLWDLKNERMVRLDSINVLGGGSSIGGFRCESFEYVPRGNEVAVGFSNTTGVGGYESRLALLGNTLSNSAKVLNLILTVERVPGVSGDDFTIGYSTTVL